MRIPIVLAASLASSLWVCACSDTANLGANRDGSTGRDGGAPARNRADECGNGIDDDGNGRIDDGCPCGTGETQACFTGAVAGRHVGACTDGVQTCRLTGVEWGDWGDSPCVGGIAPATEQCDGMDHDCDGARDEDCPCTAGMTQTCGLEFLTAPCRGGAQSCRTDGTWSACEGAIGPTPDVCDGTDNDCDGTTDEGCGCVPEPERCRDGLDNDCDGEVDEPACTPDWPPADAGVPSGDASIPDVDGGTTPCTGVGEWTVRLPVEPLGGSVDSSPGGSAQGQRLAVDGEGVLLAGRVVSARLALGSFTAVSGPFRASGGLSTNTFVAGLSPTGTIRYAYAPATRDFDPPTSFGEVPVVGASGMVSDGSGGAWLSGGFVGIVEMAPGVIFETPVPTSVASSEGDALLFHVNRSGALVEARAFGRAGQVDSFGAIARRGDQLFVAGLTGGFFDMDGTPVLPPSANAKYFLTLRPSSGSYRPERIDYVDVAGGSVLTMNPATNATDVRYGVGGAGALRLGGATVGTVSRGITAILTPTAAGYDTTSFVASDGFYAYPSSVALSAAGDTVISGGLRGTVSFGGAAISSGSATASDGFGAFIAVLRADGTHRWSRVLVPSPVDPFHSLPVSGGSSAVDADGNVYFATWFGNRAGSTIDLGGGSVTLPADALVFASYDTAGALRWSHVEASGDVRWIKDIAVDACGGVYVTGEYRIATWASGLYIRRLTTR